MVAVFLRSLLYTQTELAPESLALRQQLAILEQRSKRARLRKHDRISCAWLAQLWSNWSSILVVVQRDTVIDRVDEPHLNKFVRRYLSNPTQKCSTHHAEFRC